MSAEENKAIVRRFWQIVNELDEDAVDEVVAPEYTVESYGQRRHIGVEGVKRFIAEVRNSMPEQNGVIDEMVAEGDRVVVRAKATYRHQAETTSPWGSVIPPTGKLVTFEEIHIIRVANGKIVEEWYMTDRLGHLQARGAFDALARPSSQP